MRNPWLDLPAQAEYVVPSDSEIVARHNAKIRNEIYRLQTSIVPQAFIGSPSSDIYVLACNPGFCSEDINSHDSTNTNRGIDLTNLKRANLKHEIGNEEYPFYPLRPDLSCTSTSKWWNQRLGSLIDDIGPRELATRLFCVEYVGYHSTKFGGRIKRGSDGRLATTDYAGYLVTKAIAQGKEIVLMRSRKEWFSLVPSLDGYKRLHTTNSVQNPTITPRNLGTYDQLVFALRQSNTKAA